ncbi:MAG: VanZ family protein [Ferruginibacter sp.]
MNLYKRLPAINSYRPGIAWFFISAVLLLMPGSDLPKTVDWLDRIYFDKWVHIFIFGLMTFLFLSPLFKSGLAVSKKLSFGILTAIALINWGLTVEFLQKYYVPSRGYELSDWAADCAGVVLGSLFSYKSLKNSR